MAEPEKQNKPGRFPLFGLLAALFAALMFTSGAAGFALGRNAARSTGELMDTIVLSPGDSASRREEVLHYLSGTLLSEDGQPRTGVTVELDEDRTGVTNDYGKFYLSDVRSGKHTLRVLGSKGEELASMPLSLDFSGEGVGQDLTEGVPAFSMPDNTRLLELTFVLGQEKDLTIQEDTACFMTRDGQIIDFGGAALRVEQDELAVTPGGSVTAGDGTILLPAQGMALTPAGVQQEVVPNEAVLPGAVSEEDGSVVTEAGAVIRPDGQVEPPQGEPVSGSKVVLVKEEEVKALEVLPDSYIPAAAETAASSSSLPETDGEGLSSEGEEEPGLGNFSVLDGSGVSWKQQSAIDLFRNRTDNLNLGEEDGIPVAAPGSKGYYDFSLENPEEYDISYTLAIEEKTFHLPILYSVVDRADNTHYLHRERTNGKDALVSPKILIPAGTTQRFRIEWSWEYEDWFDPDADDALDTYGTMETDRRYEVAVQIRAEQLNDPTTVDPGDDTKYPGKH